MVNKIVRSFLLMAAVVGAVLGVVGLLLSDSVGADGHSSTRSFSPSQIAPSGEVSVGISVNNYGQFGGVAETIPADFTYVAGSSNVDVEVDGRTLEFALYGEAAVTYRVTASDTAGSYVFSGDLIDDQGNRRSIGGDNSFTVTAPPGPTAPTAQRSFSPPQIAPSGEVSVRIAVNNYGQFGGVAETIPADFTYVAGSSNVDVEVDGRTLEFALYGEAAVTYRVTASDTAGSYVFSGDLIDDQGNRRSIGGDNSFTVTAPPGPTARRSFSPPQIAPSGEVSVRIAVNNYGQFGGVAETIPADFTYVAGSSNVDVEVDGRTLEFALYGEAAVTYRVTASDTAGSYVFSGDLIDDQGIRRSIGGSSGVTVRVVAPEPDPQENRPPAFPGSSTTRSIDENSASGANVGSRVSATDRDRDRLTYALSGTDASSFTINSSSGQIMVGTGTMLDFEDKASYTVTVTATDPDGADDTITVTVTVGNVNEDGMVTLSEMRPRVGSAVTAMLSDDDEPVAGTVMWQWANSDPMAGTFADIDEATSESYTPVEGDVDMYLVAMAMYDDGHGTDKEAMMVTANPVIAASDDACLEPLGMLPRTVSGAWASDCMSEAKSGSYAEYYTFTLDSGTQVEINLTSGVDAYLALRQGAGRDGTMVGSNDNVGSRNFNSAINMMLDAGTYTVEATTYFAGQTGDFMLSVRSLQETENLGPLAGSVDRSNSMWTSDYMSTQQAGSYARSYTFTVDTATHVAINLTSPEDAYLYVLDSNGAVVHENDNVTTRNLNSRIDETLAAGTYTIEATTYHPARMGAFHLSIGVLP